MRIECPECQAEYVIDPGRAARKFARIRCAVCGHAWIRRRPAAGFAGNIDGIPSGRDAAGYQIDRVPLSRAATASRVRHLPQGQSPKRSLGAGAAAGARRGLKTLRGIAVVLFAVAVPGLLLAQREMVVRAVPQTAGLYARAGFPVNSRGLQLRDVKSILSEENSQRVLMVEGHIANIRTGTTAVPDLRVSVRAEGGREVYHWVTPAPKNKLAQGETLLFRARLVAAPEDGRDIKIQFAGKEDVPAAPGKKPAPAK